MEKDIPSKWKPKERRASNTFITQNDFKSKIVTRDKEGHYTMLKESIHQQDITIINIYTSNIRAFKYRKQVLTDQKEKVDSNTIIEGDFNIHFQQWINHPDRKSIRK